MKKYFNKIIALIIVASTMFSACQDMEYSPYEDNANAPTSETSDNDISIIRISMKNSISKGYQFDQTDDIETDKAFFGENPKKTFKTMKVYRQSDSSKYFYIMLTNLDIPYPFENYLSDTTQVENSLCGPYAGDYSNYKEYGLLYNQYSANQMCNYIFMKVLWYDKNGKPVIKNGKQRTRTIKGRFMKTPDLADLLECEEDSIICVGLHGVSEYLGDPNKSCYYNAFVFGIEEKDSEKDAYHSLGGYKDMYNMDYEEERKKWKKAHNDENFPDEILKQMWTNFYEGKNHRGYYWMAPQDRSPRMLEIYRNWGWSDNEDWLALWNIANYVNDCQYSVRLVFDPFE